MTRKIAVILEGGVVQAVVSEDANDIEVVVIDYDVQQEDANALVPQGDGEMSQAWVYEFMPTQPEIDIDGIIYKEEPEGC